MGYQAALVALADPTRQEIIERLRRAPSAVGEIAADLPVSRPAVSKHLAVLERSGLVRHERAGTRCVYRIDPTGLEEVRAYLDGLWTDVLDAFAARAESLAAQPEEPDDHHDERGADQ